ncbi:hypothetical protein [Pseudanabaena sp. FACHB-2040]|uniref:hypothetical protein n=1 Tax=Pseudanabaena sp. FACHB-2040 TaxID=2692859 RepID=UPI0019C41004|nr:hypothetical protein [Pseudanabaena sp. FACHB-2040]MBD2258390.1 hypothetical protein [Pseudanabaena sp. FACHB-2040]
MSGGVAISYVFLDILPELGEAQRILSGVAIAAKSVYLLGLLGLLLFYGFSNQQRPELQFGVTIAAYALYTLLFSYLLSHTARPIDCLLLFIAIGLHY